VPEGLGATRVADNVQTVRAYYAAAEVADWKAAGACVGPGYVWIDHGTGVVARSPEEHREALIDASPWSDTRFEITNAFETPDGTLVVQGEQSCTVTGPWRSMETTGQRIAIPFCTIFRFDSEGRIVLEEMYYDMLTVRHQLGYQ
jgi:ketosteroid isomerase-like protein